MTYIFKQFQAFETFQSYLCSRLFKSFLLLFTVSKITHSRHLNHQNFVDHQFFSTKIYLPTSFQLLKASFNWENFWWLTNEKFIFSAKSKHKKLTLDISLKNSTIFLYLDVTNELFITVQAFNVVLINTFIHISFGQVHIYIDMYEGMYPLKMSLTVNTVWPLILGWRDTFYMAKLGSVRHWRWNQWSRFMSKIHFIAK